MSMKSYQKYLKEHAKEITTYKQKLRALSTEDLLKAVRKKK